MSENEIDHLKSNGMNAFTRVEARRLVHFWDDWRSHNEHFLFDMDDFIFTLVKKGFHQLLFALIEVHNSLLDITFRNYMSGQTRDEFVQPELFVEDNHRCYKHNLVSQAVAGNETSKLSASKINDGWSSYQIKLQQYAYKSRYKHSWLHRM